MKLLAWVSRVEFSHKLTYPINVCSLPREKVVSSSKRSLLRRFEMLCFCTWPQFFEFFCFFELIGMFPLMQVEKLGREPLINCAKTAMSSKIIGPDSEFFSKMVPIFFQLEHGTCCTPISPY